MTESPEAGAKRMRMRAWRRGTKEMDLILGPFADARLAGLAPDDLALFDVLLSENDHDLYAWITGAQPVPERFAALIGVIGDFARGRLGVTSPGHA